MKPLMGIGAVVLVLVLLVGGCGVQGYNTAVTKDEAVKTQWAQVENQLQRRYDLIPNLVATVKGETEQEKAIFLGIADARKAYFQYQGAKTTAEKTESANQVESALSRLAGPARTISPAPLQRVVLETARRTRRHREPCFRRAQELQRRRAQT